MGRLIKVVWLVVALAGSAGLILWMADQGDLGAKMSDHETKQFKLQY